MSGIINDTYPPQKSGPKTLEYIIFYKLPVIILSIIPIIVSVIINYGGFTIIEVLIHPSLLVLCGSSIATLIIDDYWDDSARKGRMKKIMVFIAPLLVGVWIYTILIKTNFLDPSVVGALVAIFLSCALGFSYSFLKHRKEVQY